jgi:radical SAM superfamily enzyme YgiQ (UPF0313 family)
MAEVAFLVYDPSLKSGRRKSKSFDWSTNTGAYVVIDCLQRAGIDVEFCCAENAHNYKVVLISLTSTFDVYHLIADVAKLSTWRKRDFVSIAGGFGLQNIYPLRHYVDWAVLGRAESFVVDLVKAALNRSDYEHESVMPLSQEIKPVKVSQAEELYPYKLDTKPICYQESEIGCPRKCLFCHYSFSRQYQTSNDESFQGNMGWASKEVLFDKILEDTNGKTKIRTALDGLSQRLRYAFNKRLSNDLIKETIERVSTDWAGKAAWITCYHIGSYPTETEADRQEFNEIMRSCEPTGKKVYMDVHVTPFRPSPLTPSAYLPADLSINWNKRSSVNIAHKPLLESYYMPCLESPYPHLQSLVAERATEQSDELIERMCFDKSLLKLSADQKMWGLGKHYDLTQYTREYKTTEQLPTWYLESYIDNAAIAKMARKLKSDLGIPELAPELQ